MPNLVSLICPSLQILDKTLDGGIFDSRISGQSLLKANCRKSRTSDYIDMKFRPVTKLDKKSKATSKKFDDDIMTTNCDVLVFFPIYGQFGAIRKPDSGSIVCKIYIFININSLSYKH